MTHLSCEVTPMAQSERFTDDLLGEISIGPMVKRAAVVAQPVVIENDPELGPLVLGPALATQALPPRTGPPRLPSKAGER